MGFKAKYINKGIYTDVRSWMVYDIDEEKGTATAVEVEKTIHPDAVTGGFAAHFNNLHELYRNAIPVVKKDAVPFAIKRDKNGVWGVTLEKLIWSVPMAAVDKKWLEENQNNPSIQVDGDWVRVFDLTAKGKKKYHFEKLGKLEDECNYFYDFNF